MGLAVAGQSMMMLFTTTFEALGRNVLGFRLAFSESAIQVAATVTLVLAGAGVVGATAGRATGYGVAAILGLAITLRAIGRRNLRVPSPTGLGIRQIALYAGALLLIDSAFTAFGYIDTILIGAIRDPEAAGLFSAPYQILVVAEYVGMALAAAVAPRLARSEGAEPDVRALQMALRVVLIFQFVLLAPIVVWADPITDLLFGSDYAESADVFRALAPYVLMVGVGPVIALSVNYLGEARRRIPLAVGALVINVVLDLILIPKIGIVAGAIGTDVAFGFFLTGHLLIARSLLGLNLRPLGATLIRVSAAAGVMAGVLFAFGTETLTTIEWIAGGALGLAAYAGVLVATREIGRREIEEFRGLT